MHQLNVFTKSPDFARFKAYHEANPQLYNLFEMYAIQAIKRGHRRLSAEFLFNVIRWETPAKAEDGDFKINNDMKPWYSRLFLAKYPQHKQFFETRRSKADLMDGHFRTGW